MDLVMTPAPYMAGEWLPPSYEIRSANYPAGGMRKEWESPRWHASRIPYPNQFGDFASPVQAAEVVARWLEQQEAAAQGRRAAAREEVAEGAAERRSAQEAAARRRVAALCNTAGCGKPEDHTDLCTPYMPLAPRCRPAVGALSEPRAWR